MSLERDPDGSFVLHFRRTSATYALGTWKLRQRSWATVSGLVLGLLLLATLVFVFVQPAVSLFLGVAIVFLAGVFPVAGLVGVFVPQVLHPRAFPGDEWIVGVAVDGLDVRVGDVAYTLHWEDIHRIWLGGAGIWLRLGKGILLFPAQALEDPPQVLAAIEALRNAGTTTSRQPPPSDALGLLEYTLTEDDHVAWNRVLLREQRVFTIVRLLVGGLFFGVGLLVVALAASGIVPMWVAVFPLGFAALAFGAVGWQLLGLRHRVRSIIRKGNAYVGPGQLAWTQAGLWSQGRTPFELAWEGIQRIQVDDDHVYVRLHGMMGLVVPKGAFGSDLERIVADWRELKAQS